MRQFLPDRERRHLLQFHLLPSLRYEVRLVCAASLIVFAFFIQVFWAGASPEVLMVVTVPLLLAGNLFLLVKGYNLQPSHRLFGGDWEKTTRDRFDAARKLEEQVKGWDETLVDITCVSGFCGLIAVALVVGLVYLNLDDWATVFAVDAAVLILPHWITGTRRIWRPVGLREQLNSLETALAVIEQFEEPACQIQPMFEMAGKGDKRTPVAARVFIRFPDADADFLGVQFQVALNDVQGTKYPYLYAVLIAKMPFGLFKKHLSRIMADSGGLTVETSAEEDVEVIIIRQHTTKKSGYHTDVAAICRIAGFVWQSTADILQTAPSR